MKPFNGRLTVRLRLLGPVAVLCVALAGLLGGCGGSSTTTSTAVSAASPAGQASGVQGNELTFANSQAPGNLNPALTDIGPYEVYMALAYDSLTYVAPNGSVAPRLATSWHYVGRNNTEFQLTIRQGARFSDGEPVTADAVANSIEYFSGAHGPSSSVLANLKSVIATGDNVLVTMKSPSPDLPELFSQKGTPGAIIAPAGVKNPRQLGNRTLGAGPYVLDAAATVAGSTYTYTPNPDYWDKSAVHWRKIVVKVFSTPTAAFQALQTGSVQAMLVDPSAAAQLDASLYTVVSSPAQQLFINIADKYGKVVPALGKVQVRQAMNYALDRTAIAKSLYVNYGQATDQIQGPGYGGYQEQLESAYPYDVSEAKRLLAQAGYPHGFTFTVIEPPGMPSNALEAVTQEWAQVGINAKIEATTSPAQFIAAWASGRTPAMIAQNTFNEPFLEWEQLLNPMAPLNVTHYQDPKVTALVASAAAETDQPKANQIWDQVFQTIVKDAWNVSIVDSDVVYFMDKNIAPDVGQGDRMILSPRDLAPATG